MPALDLSAVLCASLLLRRVGAPSTQSLQQGIDYSQTVNEAAPSKAEELPVKEGSAGRKKEMLTTPEPAPALPWQVKQASTCVGSMVDWHACPDLPRCTPCVPEDCSFEAWSDWSVGDCTGLCERQRNVASQANECGMPCSGTLIEAKNGTECDLCGNKKIDCEWSVWSEWSMCTCTCGGGQKTRDRQVQVAPKNHGDLCEPREKTEIVPCNTQHCRHKCVDFVWTEWQDWSSCSNSCAGGQRQRTRAPLTENNFCGTVASGFRKELEPCNTNVSCLPTRDCTFEPWSGWTPCSCTCNGVMRRSRHIEEYGRGNGKFCNGATKEVAPCNPPDENKAHCQGLPAYDCELGDWMPWTSCSLSCGGGQKTREKHYVRHASNGGDPCAGDTMQVTGCNTEECPLFVGDVDCEWGDWSDWSDCYRSHGQRKRFRAIEQMAEGAGLNCGNMDSEENEPCSDAGPSHFYCEWGDWEPYGPCSATCGAGIRMRQRHLGSTTELPTAELPTAELPVEAKYEALAAAGASLSAGRARDVSMAFAAGFVSLVAIFLAQRAVPRPAQRQALTSLAVAPAGCPARPTVQREQTEGDELPLLFVLGPDS